MGIQVANSLHAAGTYFVQEPDPVGEPDVFVHSQSTNGMLISRLVLDEILNVVVFQILLDFPLDPGSCAYSCAAYASLDPLTAEDFFKPFTPMLIHITEKEKVLLLVDDPFEPVLTVDAAFHLEFTNFQANLREALPVNDFIPPPVGP